MGLGEVVATMREIKRRQLIGRLVRSEVALQGTVEDAAEAAKISSLTLYQVFNADWTITGVKLRSLEKALGLSDNLLAYILAGDSETIAALNNSEISSGLRLAILAGLTRIAAEEVEVLHDYLPVSSEMVPNGPVSDPVWISTTR
jgi:hypothetical protein